MTAAPRALIVDSGGDQFPVTELAPRLSWQLPPEAGTPSGHEVEWCINDAATGITELGPEHLFVSWPGPVLASRQRVAWRVRVLADGDTGAWSQWALFEVGLLDADWQAKWVSPVEDGDPGYGRRPAHRLSVDFEVQGEVRRARLYATALGLYEPFVNGDRVGGIELAPGSTSYDQTLHAQAYDVTDAVRPGANELGILLSDGWYRGQVGAFRMPAQWGATLGLRAELHLDLADGSYQVIRTDGNWRCAPSQIVQADLMEGQCTDLTVAGPEPVPVKVGEVTAPPISWSSAPPVRAVETRAPITVTRVAEDAWVADFGQNASGWLRLSDLGEHGTRTVIDHGEWVGPDGDLDTSHLDSSRPGGESMVFVQRDEVISDGSGAVFEPRHTVHGFQYVRIRREGSPLDPASVEMVVVQTALRRTGSFRSSDEDLNRLHEIADWSFRGNAVDVPTDCPTRERLAWTGDYQVFAPTATRLYDVLGFTRKWLQSVRDDQLDDGRIANFSPDGRQIKHNLDDQFAMMTGSSGWGDAIVAVPWEMYESYGDLGILRENWTAMRRWVDWALNNARTARHHTRQQNSPDPQPHEQYLWDGSFHWGEWTEPQQKAADGTSIDPIKDNPVVWFMADKGEVGTAYLHRSTATLARVAALLGHSTEADEYARLAALILDAWRAEYLLPDGRTVADTQAAYVRALKFGLIPDGQRQAAVNRLVELIGAADMHVGTGFLATGHLLPVLADHGRADVAHALLKQRTPPSWLYMLDRGATTIWENWEGIDEEGRAHDSLNHYSKGSVIRYLHTHTLGLRQNPGSIAWREFTVAPVPDPSLTWVEGTHESPLGTIEVRWEQHGSRFHLDVTIPHGAAATIRLPDGSESRHEGPTSIRRETAG